MKNSSLYSGVIKMKAHLWGWFVSYVKRAFLVYKNKLSCENRNFLAFISQMFQDLHFRRTSLSLNIQIYLNVLKLPMKAVL